MGVVLSKLMEFKNKYPSTVMWRLKAHSKVIEANLHSDEKVLYVFAGQKNYNHLDIFNTFVIVLTNQRLICSQKRLIIGFSLNSVTPDMFNDIQITSGLFWGTVIIDTIKEVIYLTNVSKKSLSEIQKIISEYMINEKKKYTSKN